MARKVTKRLRDHVQSEVSPLIEVFLITLYHEDLSEPIRVSSDPTERVGSDAYNVYYGTISQGRIFYYAGFEACMLNDEDGAAPQTQISIARIPQVVEAIESMGPGPLTADIELVLADTPDIIEVSMLSLELVNPEYGEEAVTATISRDLLFSEPYPGRTFIPQHFPYLFGARGT